MRFFQLSPITSKSKRRIAKMDLNMLENAENQPLKIMMSQFCLIKKYINTVSWKKKKTLNLFCC